MGPSFNFRFTDISKCIIFSFVLNLFFKKNSLILLLCLFLRNPRYVVTIFWFNLFIVVWMVPWRYRHPVLFHVLLMPCFSCLVKALCFYMSCDFSCPVIFCLVNALSCLVYVLTQDSWDFLCLVNVLCFFLLCLCPFSFFVWKSLKGKLSFVLFSLFSKFA